MTIPIIVGAGWVILAVMMKKPYRDGLLQLLRSSSLDFNRSGELEKLSLDRNTMNLLLSTLESADFDFVVVAGIDRDYIRIADQRIPVFRTDIGTD